MWLVITFLTMIAAILMFITLKKRREQLKLGMLVLMLAGTFLMILVDHIMTFLKDGTFIVFTTNGLIKSGTLLGILMVLPVLAVWGIAITIPILTKHKEAI